MSLCVSVLDSGEIELCMSGEGGSMDRSDSLKSNTSSTHSNDSASHRNQKSKLKFIKNIKPEAFKRPSVYPSTHPDAAPTKQDCMLVGYRKTVPTTYNVPAMELGTLCPEEEEGEMEEEVEVEGVVKRRQKKALAHGISMPSLADRNSLFFVHSGSMPDLTKSITGRSSTYRLSTSLLNGSYHSGSDPNIPGTVGHRSNNSSGKSKCSSTISTNSSSTDGVSTSKLKVTFADDADKNADNTEKSVDISAESNQEKSIGEVSTSGRGDNSSSSTNGSNNAEVGMTNCVLKEGNNQAERNPGCSSSADNLAESLSQVLVDSENSMNKIEIVSAEFGVVKETDLNSAASMENIVPETPNVVANSLPNTEDEGASTPPPPLSSIIKDSVKDNEANLYLDSKCTVLELLREEYHDRKTKEEMRNSGQQPGGGQQQQQASLQNSYVQNGSLVTGDHLSDRYVPNGEDRLPIRRRGSPSCPCMPASSDSTHNLLRTPMSGSQPITTQPASLSLPVAIVTSHSTPELSSLQTMQRLVSVVPSKTIE